MPHRTRRDIEESYDVTYAVMPDIPHISRIIDHPRKLIIINLCADPWNAQPEEIYREPTCFDDDDEEYY